MSDVIIRLQRPYTKQQEYIANRKRNNLLLLARRSGKTTLSKILVLKEAIEVPNYRVAWSSPNWKFLIETFEEFIHILKPLTSRVNRADRRIQLRNGSVIEFWSSNDPSAGRGRKYHRWVSDETQKQKNLSEFLKGSVRPSLADFQGELWVLGTANGEGTEFHQLFLEAKEKPHSWQVVQGSLEDNPYIKKEEILLMREELGPLLSAQELDSQWVPINGMSPLIGMFDWKDLYSVPDTIRPQKVMALDASISGDTTGLIAAWRDLITQSYYTDYDDIHIFYPTLEDPETNILQIDFAILENQIWRMWQTGAYAALVYDPYQAVALAQRLRRRGVRTIEFTQNIMRIKADSYLRQVLNDGNYHHPNHEELNTHIKNATVKYNNNGGLRIVKSDKTKKIDLAVALSMSLYAMNTLKPGVVSKYVPEVANYNTTQVDSPVTTSYSPFGNSKDYSPFKR